jgi:hypothetical protein
VNGDERFSPAGTVVGLRAARHSRGLGATSLFERRRRAARVAARSLAGAVAGLQSRANAGRPGVDWDTLDTAALAAGGLAAVVDTVVVRTRESTVFFRRTYDGSSLTNWMERRAIACHRCRMKRLEDPSKTQYDAEEPGTQPRAKGRDSKAYRLMGV